jgi:hypothetical protein
VEQQANAAPDDGAMNHLVAFTICREAAADHLSHTILHFSPRSSTIITIARAAAKAPSILNAVTAAFGAGRGAVQRT